LSTPRIYLTGRVSLEHADCLVTERDLPGRQGRLAFVFLAANRGRPISRGELVEVIWPDQPPQDIETGLSAILSKLRAALKKMRWLPSEATIDVRSSSIGIRLPPQTWVDIEDAANAIDEAEGALRAGDPAKAWGFANVVVSIARRPFLTDHDAPWIEARRVMQRTLLTRGLQCLATASESSGEPSLAIQYATAVLDLEPFRETAYQQLMRLHATMGNRAEALRVFGQCRKLLRDELGASPSPQTEAVFLKILRARETG
jgi:SARP family transcriptional regulator, regulator of embCAB operon